MEEKRILFQLPYGELSVAAIKQELSKRQVRPTNILNKMVKADLSELLRMTLEKTQTLDSLIELRAYEIDAIQYVRRDTLMARLRSRGLMVPPPTEQQNKRSNSLFGSGGGDREVLLQRLCNVLQQEKADFEQQNKENIPPQVHEGEKEGKKLTDDDHHNEYKPAAAAAAITPEQRRRMERNRKRALELQAEKRQEKEKQQRRSIEGSRSSVVSITPIRAPPAATAGPPLVTAAGENSVEEMADDIFGAPIAFDYCTPVKPETTTRERLLANPYVTLKRTGVAATRSSVTKLYSPVSPVTKLNNPNQTSSPPPPARQQELCPCSRCGDTRGDKQGLCIVWNHSGDIQRESFITTTPSGYDQFRWDCCGRLDGQPCFVGIHNRPGGGGGSGNGNNNANTGTTTGTMMIMCNCQEVAYLRRTRKPTSPNRGRYFFCCFSHNCKFFRWADEAFGLSSKDNIPLVSPDGVREWEIPFANPFGEHYRHLTADHHQNQPQEGGSQQRRKRLVAALLLQEMCNSVKGQQGVGGGGGGGLNNNNYYCSNNGICSKELATHVLHTVHNGGDTILWKLQPLTSQQLSRRFGWPNDVSLVGLDQKECEMVLLDMLDNSQWIKSIGIRYQHSAGTAVLTGESSVFVDLAGLEGYLNA